MRWPHQRRQRRRSEEHTSELQSLRRTRRSSYLGRSCGPDFVFRKTNAADAFARQRRGVACGGPINAGSAEDRKSTRLNSSHLGVHDALPISGALADPILSSGKRTLLTPSLASAAVSHAVAPSTPAAQSDPDTPRIPAERVGRE